MPSVWLPEFDKEHDELFRIADEIRSAMQEGALLRAVEPLLQELNKHAREHFANEEKQMRSTRYPLLAWHRKQHDTVRRKLENLARSVAQGDRESVLPTLDFLAGWLRDHTSVADRMMASYLRNQTRGHRLAS